jgi:hypothetical protein
MFKFPKKAVLRVAGYDLLTLETSYPSAFGPAQALCLVGAAFVSSALRPIATEIGGHLLDVVRDKLNPRASQ